MEIFKVFKPKRKKGSSPADMMRGLEDTIKKRDKKASYRWKDEKKK